MHETVFFLMVAWLEFSWDKSAFKSTSWSSAIKFPNLWRTSHKISRHSHFISVFNPCDRKECKNKLLRRGDETSKCRDLDTWYLELTGLVIPFINCGDRVTRIDWARDIAVTSDTIVFKAMLAMSRCWSLPCSNFSHSLLVISTTRASLTFFTNGARLQQHINEKHKNQACSNTFTWHLFHLLFPLAVHT